MKVQVRSYASPGAVLLALDWPEGAKRVDFLGFAIRRTPGFKGASPSWLTNLLGFDGPAASDTYFPSNQAPIQKFMWWDAHFEDKDHGKNFSYELHAVVGDPKHPSLAPSSKATIAVRLPKQVEDGVGTWFNRAIVSSQAFAKQLKKMGISKTKLPTAAQEKILRAWLANGLEKVVPQFLADARFTTIDGAIYHLTDEDWIVPAFAASKKAMTIVYDSSPVYVKNKATNKSTKQPGPNAPYVAKLSKNKHLTFKPRDKSNIMHDKFLVGSKGAAKNVLMGSANFTTGGLSSQANVLHTIDSKTLAELYLARQTLLQSNPTLAKTAQGAAWSDWTPVAGGRARVFFSPENAKPPGRLALAPVVRAIKDAKRSVLFCIFTPTDAEVREACLKRGDDGLMMFGLVNNIPDKEPKPGKNPEAADFKAEIELFHRSREQRDVIDAMDFYDDKDLPQGFLPEVIDFPSKTSTPPWMRVLVHHKFILIDGETKSPTLFTGSANVSANSQYNNDENMLQVEGSRQLADIYFAEFFRLYEQHRARAARKANSGSGSSSYKLAPDSSWSTKFFNKYSPAYKARVAMVKPL